MIEVVKTDTFERWLLGLNDRQAVQRIAARIRRMSTGNLGDVKYLREGVSEARVAHGPGYRLYFIRRGALVIILLAGGDKRTQRADIEHAVAMAHELKE